MIHFALYTLQTVITVYSNGHKIARDFFHPFIINANKLKGLKLMMRWYFFKLTLFLNSS